MDQGLRLALQFVTLLLPVSIADAFQMSVDHLVVTAAEADPVYGSNGGHAITLPGIGTDFVFPGGGEFFRLPNGTARLTGMIRSRSAPAKCFAVDLEFGFPSAPGDPSYPPAGSPKLELASSAYVANGGPIDPSTWIYFQGTLGTLRGLEDYAGAILSIAGTGPAFQLGRGANGKNLQRGGSGWVIAQTVHQPAQGTPFSTTIAGDFNVDFGVDSTRCADAAIGNAQYLATPAGHAWAWVGVASDFILQAGGQLVEYANGTAEFHGVLARESDPTKVFSIDVQFSGRVNPGRVNYPPPGSPKKELLPSAYVENGGPVDTNTWYYYTVANGRLTGFEDYTGALVQLSHVGPSFQIGIGANGKNLHFGGSTWFNANVQQQPTSGPPLPSNTMADLNIDLDRDCFFCVDRADALAGFGINGGHAFALPGVGNGQFVFLAAGQYVETAAGTAQLSGEIVNVIDPNQKFAVVVDFASRVDSGDPGYPPPGSPHLELTAAAYVTSGGPIDPATWHYFLETNGTLYGLGAFQGAVLSFDRFGPAFQVGVGANGKNFHFGASGWLDVHTLVQPTNGPSFPLAFQGDINVDLRNECVFCPTRADADPQVAINSGGHVLILPGVGPSPVYVFLGNGRFTEYSMGSARLKGIVVNLLDPNKQFQMTLSFLDRVNPGYPGYPPPGSPKKELVSSAYVENGGPIDTDTWHYYLVTGGFLSGLGDYAGAKYDVSRDGPAFQVGVGASGLNLDHGASGWLTLLLVTQPTTGGPLPVNVAGDVNINLFDDCP